MELIGLMGLMFRLGRLGTVLWMGLALWVG